MDSKDKSENKTHMFYIAARGSSKPVTNFIQLLETLYGTSLTKKEKLEIWNAFYGGVNN